MDGLAKDKAVWLQSNRRTERDAILLLLEVRGPVSVDPDLDNAIKRDVEWESVRRYHEGDSFPRDWKDSTILVNFELMVFNNLVGFVWVFIAFVIR